MFGFRFGFGGGIFFEYLLLWGFGLVDIKRRKKGKIYECNRKIFKNDLYLGLLLLIFDGGAGVVFFIFSLRFRLKIK